MTTVIDLFSCVGCHHMGFTDAGLQTTQFVELDPWRQAILQRRWPNIPLHDDVRTFHPRKKAGVIFGGPPCKATSVSAARSGKRTGETLWPEMFRIGLEARAEWYVVEQPPGNAAWEGKVIDDLSGAGYHVARLVFGAHDIGAPYPRRRVYIIASSSRKRLEVAWAARGSAIERAKRTTLDRGHWDPAAIPPFGVDTWRSEQPNVRRARIEALGDSNPPAMAMVLGLMVMEAI